MKKIIIIMCIAVLFSANLALATKISWPSEDEIKISEERSSRIVHDRYIINYTNSNVDIYDNCAKTSRGLINFPATFEGYSYILDDENKLDVRNLNIKKFPQCIRDDIKKALKTTSIISIYHKVEEPKNKNISMNDWIYPYPEAKPKSNFFQKISNWFANIFVNKK